MYEDLLYAAAVVLLPLIPAYLLFRYLPSAGEVESGDGLRGIFQGLQFKFGGAFAGYLVVFWLTSRLLQPSGAEVWRVDGEVQLSGEPDALGSLEVLLVPDRIHHPEGSARWRLWVVREPESLSEFPTLIVDVEGYRTENIDLAEVAAKNWASRRIELDPVVLTPEPEEPYSPPVGEARLQPAEASGGLEP